MTYLILELISCEADINTQFPDSGPLLLLLNHFPFFYRVTESKVLLKFKYFLIFSLTSNKIFPFIVLFYSLQSA